MPNGSTGNGSTGNGSTRNGSTGNGSTRNGSTENSTIGNVSNGDGDTPSEGRQSGEKEIPVRPIPIHEYVLQSEVKGVSPESSESSPADSIPAGLVAVRQRLEQAFHLPQNKDIVLREFHLGSMGPQNGLIVFVDGMVDKMLINTHILQPLMLLAHFTHTDVHGRMETVLEALLPGNQVTETNRWPEVLPGILSGSTAVFIDGGKVALIVESKGWEHRSVGLSQTENVVKGPHDAFTESFRSNTGLVRAQLRSPDLVTEILTVGKLAGTDVAVMYIHGLTNTRLVDEVKRRIQLVDVDYLADVGTMEQFLEDNPRVWIPQTLSTERPDRVAHMLTEGHVAIFVGNSPYALTVPVVLWTLVHTPEDAYLRFPFGSFLRILRLFAMMVALLLPGLYVAITNFHPEMIPTDLLLAIAGNREQVPFAAIVEILMMEFAIELIREAGIRIPSIIGPTIGIVGALIIGQAAVQAGVVSPLLVIVVAITALASFSMPNYNLAFGIRIMRFVFLFVAAAFGFYGLTLLFMAMLAKLSVQKSFGVPLLAPVAPSMDTSEDVLLRGPAYVMNERPGFLQVQKAWRQRPYTRSWSSTTNESIKPKEAQGGNDGGQPTK
ncbi:spore germination protein [Alicyclobacillaceae bacterium I2511]|nr:spore germination protein [Alicyclobacillaceae bacterium I2511]